VEKPEGGFNFYLDEPGKAKFLRQVKGAHKGGKTFGLVHFHFGQGKVPWGVPGTGPGGDL